MNPKQHPGRGREYRERARRMLAWARQGISKAEIGRQYGCSGQRVGQILADCRRVDEAGLTDSVFAGLWAQHLEALRRSKQRAEARGLKLQKRVERAVRALTEEETLP